jgi:hypothetical protein
MTSRPRKTAASVELFPFLAVLMCTMGALILLLLVIVRHAREAAVEAARSKPRPDYRLLLEERQRLAAEADALQAGRDDARAGLATATSRAAELDAQLARLRRELAELEAQGASAPPAADDDQRLREFDRLRELIAETAERLDTARGAAAAQGPSYAILPYEGPNGTLRRPVYIECRSDCVVLQPEGVTLREADFQGHMAAGNPLAAAVRTAIHYHRQVHPEGGDPYPLLIVRPDGIGAY